MRVGVDNAHVDGNQNRGSDNGFNGRALLPVIIIIMIMIIIIII